MYLLFLARPKGGICAFPQLERGVKIVGSYFSALCGGLAAGFEDVAGLFFHYR